MSDPTIDKTGPVRRFDIAAINAQLDKGIQEIPPGKTIAAIGVYDSNNGAYLALVGKAKWDSVDINWSVMAVKPTDQPFSYGGRVVASW